MDRWETDKISLDIMPPDNPPKKSPGQNSVDRYNTDKIPLI